MESNREPVRESDYPMRPAQRLLNASISAHLWIGTMITEQDKKKRLISYAVLAALEMSIKESGGQLVGDSFENLAAKDSEAQKEIRSIFDEMRRQKL